MKTSNKRSKAYQKLKQLFLTGSLSIPKNKPENLYLWKTVNDDCQRKPHINNDAEEANLKKEVEKFYNQIKSENTDPCQYQPATIEWFRESIEKALPYLNIKKIQHDSLKQIITITVNEIFFSLSNAKSIINEYKPIGILIVIKKDVIKLINLHPETSAQRTIHWFMYGRKFLTPPKHWNCRCSSTVLESKEGILKRINK